MAPLRSGMSRGNSKNSFECDTHIWNNWKSLAVTKFREIQKINLKEKF